MNLYQVLRPVVHGNASLRQVAGLTNHDGATSRLKQCCGGDSNRFCGNPLMETHTCESGRPPLNRTACLRIYRHEREMQPDYRRQSCFVGSGEFIRLPAARPTAVIPIRTHIMPPALPNTKPPMSQRAIDNIIATINVPTLGSMELTFPSIRFKNTPRQCRMIAECREKGN